MPHIHTEAGHHDHTVSFFIVRTDFDEPKLTYHVHRKTGNLSMFGGHVELDETPWQSMLHEITEESGFDHDQLQILQPVQRLKSVSGVVTHPQPVYVHTGQFPIQPPHFHTDMMYALVANEAPRQAPLEGESTDIRLFNLEELAQVPAEEIFEAWREIGAYILKEVLPSWERLPLTTFDHRGASYDAS